MGRYYRLDDRHTLIECSAPDMGLARVALDMIGGVDISTVFLGIDHRFGGGGPPILFETMIFGGGPHDENCERYCTWDEAVAGHARWCAKIRSES